MSIIKKTAALAGTLLILTTGIILAQEQTKAEEANKVQVKAQTQTRTQTQTAAQTAVQTRSRMRTQFVDQNGDGVNDLMRDADGDGIPNCQDPDWTRPQDGTGYQNRFGRAGAGKNGVISGKGSAASARSMTNRSFRNSAPGAGFCTGTGICDGTGPKGKITRRGRG